MYDQIKKIKVTNYVKYKMDTKVKNPTINVCTITLNEIIMQ